MHSKIVCAFMGLAVASSACSDAPGGDDTANATDAVAEEVLGDDGGTDAVGTLLDADPGRVDATVASDAGVARLDATSGSDAAPPTPRHEYASSRADLGTVDANTRSYVYAPAFVFSEGRYHYFACSGVAGDFIQHKSATTLAGLAAAPLETVLTPLPGETHTCDPAVVRGADGRWYLHYSNRPAGMLTGAGVAVADDIAGPYTHLSTNLLGLYPDLHNRQYGRGQTSVAQGPDGQWYMAFSNQILPIEPHSIVILRSPDPTFATTRTEVTRFDPAMVAGWSTQLSYDPQSGSFVFVEPAGVAGFTVTRFDRAFHFVARETVALPPGAGVPGEGQAFLTDATGRLLTTSPDAPGSIVLAGATHGPARDDFPMSVTGPNEWRRYRVDPLGQMDLVTARPGAVRVAGWSYDPNDPAWPLETHIYLAPAGGHDSSGTNAGPTDVPRPDVDRREGTTGSHGFDVVIPTRLRGQVAVCTAAINVGSGSNTWLGCRDITVTD